MLSTSKRQANPYNTQITALEPDLEQQLRAQLPPPTRVVASKKNCKDSSKIDCQTRTVTRLRSRLLRHLNSICPDKKDLAQQIQVLKVFNKPNCLGRWHRQKIIGQISLEFSPNSERKLRLIIAELIADLGEDLGGAA